jgi:hypothetical protein
MAQRPSFDMTKLTTADKILLGGALLFVINSFLPWQRACVGEGAFRFCASFSAWGGTASWLGVLAGLLAILLLLAGGLSLAGVAMPPTMPVPTVMSWLAFGTALVAVLKFLLVVTESVFFFAFIGLILALVIAYGGWMKTQEVKVLPPPAVGPEPGPPVNP